jgi:hypothetical protein
MGENNLAAVAIDLAAYGVVMKLNGQPGEAVIAVRQAYAAALSEWSGLLVSVDLRPPREVTRLAHAEHFLFKLGRNALSVEARNDGVQQAVGHLRRFPMIGALCKMVAPMLDDERRAEFIIDISDGSDCGDYWRFAFSSARPDAILLPDPYFVESYGYQDLRQGTAAQGRTWRERKDVVFWRGAATGVGVRPWPAPGEPMDFHCLKRVSLCAVAAQSSWAHRIDIGLTSLDLITRPDIREKIIAAGLTRAPVDKSAFMGYRYLVDIDGNSNSWGMFEKMIMGATLVKVASMNGYRQWYYHRLKPWVHFVPIAADLGDFEAKIEWVFAHPEACEEIAANGAALAGELRYEREIEGFRRAWPRVDKI